MSPKKISKFISTSIKSLNQKRRKPEIIAVLCVHNEQLNIDTCLYHLEPYVEKIVILDDGSTDDTIKIAKQHKKVIKVISSTTRTKWDERKNRETVLKEAFNVSKKQNAWALCIDADERFEEKFLQNIKKITKKYSGKNLAINIHFRELWDTPYQYRVDGIWNTKRKDLLLPLSKKMTFCYPQEHHFPWHYSELNNREVLLDYNLYHLKMIKKSDRKKRAILYNQLDPHKRMQPIGYDYLTDTTNMQLIKIPQSKKYNYKTIPKYYLSD